MSDLHNLFLKCLSLSEQVIQAAEKGRWEVMVELQARWQQAVSQYMEQVASLSDTGDAQGQLERLLEDVAQKSARLERIIKHLQAQQQRDLQQLRQAKSYLSPP